MLVKDFDYQLPEELIAQFPAETRDSSNLMVLSRKNRAIEHKKFFNITECLTENDVLVLNNTKVIPARLIGKKATGAVIEVFLLQNVEKKNWLALIKPSKRVRTSTNIVFSEELTANVISREDNDKWLVELAYEGDFNDILQRNGNIPLPPYISRNTTDDKTKKLDLERYQTVFARQGSSVAAPTAGLHFTEEILDKLKAKGVQIHYVTLNVGLGTFKPVKTENILEHKMDSEYYEISEETAKAILKAKKEGKNVVAVGTTTTRTLETAFDAQGNAISLSGWSSLFIYPGYSFKVVDKLLTNFHLPKSTLLMLVSAFAGKDFVFEAYKQAIEKQYRFYSYGDCMYIQ
ncbi:MAG: tRNA preQ1(34) S-adenosylmethionine ribosyltransferase-isomerase QueA [Candidatus Gastranaerophilales bacterium]|nr:tRNA preQ1(34) S-adenosylmethionine ribosyltransferase-isomerase QueA [Candidatus Gastranaerophilales bacterium]